MNTTASNTNILEIRLPEISATLRGIFTVGSIDFETRSQSVLYGVSPRSCFVVESLPESERVIDSEITTFVPEPYTLKSNIGIKIVGQGSEYIASYHEGNIHASGDTPYEAMENLKSLILDTFDSLTSEPQENLGIKAKNQRALLESIIERQ